MSSQADVRRGSQEPRIKILPGEPAYTDGDDIAEFHASYSFTLDPWQRNILRGWASRGDDDTPYYRTLILSVPRQNGKNGTLEAYEFYMLAVCGEKILHTAHQVKTAAKSFQRLCSMFENTAHPELMELVDHIRRTNGEQGIYLKNGGFIEYSARSRGASRGNTYSIVVYDEAQELTDEQAEALMATISASPTGYRQVVYMGTPPGPGSPGTVFPRVRKAAIEDAGERTCLFEWSVKDAPPQSATFEDVIDLVYETNPAMGYRLDIDFTGDEFKTMTREGFARERLNWWQSITGVHEITEEEWEATYGTAPDEVDRIAYGVKFSPDGQTVALGICAKGKDGDPHVEAIEHRQMSDGTDWLADWLAQRRDVGSCVVIDGKSGTSDLVAKLNDRGVSRRAIVTCGVKEVVAATSRYRLAITDRRVTHYRGEMQAPLDNAALSAVKRPIGNNGGYGWGRSTEEYDITPLEAVTLAYYGLMTCKRKPGRKARIL